MEIMKLPKGITQEQAQELIRKAIGSSVTSIYSWGDGVNGIMSITADSFYFIDVKNPEKKN